MHIQRNRSSSARMRKEPALVAATTLTALLSLCGCTTQYTFNGIAYPTPDEAYAAQRSVLEAELSHVDPIEIGLDARAVVVIPSQKRIIERGFVTYSENTPEASKYYVAQILQNAYRAMGLAIKTTRAFSSVAIYTSDDPESEASATHDEHYAVWLHLESANVAQWYMRPSESDDRIPLPIDHGQPVDWQVAVWAKSVAELAIERAGTSRGTRARDAPAESASGSGFAISADGYYLTSYHVVDKCESITLPHQGHDVELTVAYADEVNDLAILKGQAVSGTYATFAADRPPRLTEEVVVVGFPLRGLLSSTASVTTGSVSNLAGIRNDTRFLQISAPVQQGSSGGPVIDRFGRIVGVVTSKLNALSVALRGGDIPQNVNFALKHSVATTVLDAAGVDYHVGRAGAEKLDRASVSEAGQQMTFSIVCRR